MFSPLVLFNGGVWAYQPFPCYWRIFIKKKMKKIIFIIKIWLVLALITPFIMIARFGERITELIENKLLMKIKIPRIK